MNEWMDETNNMNLPSLRFISNAGTQNRKTFPLICSVQKKTTKSTIV